jgi:hypothetical protein
MGRGLTLRAGSSGAYLAKGARHCARLGVSHSARFDRRLRASPMRIENRLRGTVLMSVAALCFLGATPASRVALVVGSFKVELQSPRPRSPMDPAAISWTGRAGLTECRRVYGGGRDPCPMASRAPHPIELLLYLTDQYVSGRLSLFVMAATGSVSGVNASQTLRLTAVLGRSEDDGVVAIANWKLAELETGFAASELHVRRDWRNLSGRQVTVEKYGVSALTRRAE